MMCKSELNITLLLVANWRCERKKCYNSDAYIEYSVVLLFLQLNRFQSIFWARNSGDSSPACPQRRQQRHFSRWQDALQGAAQEPFPGVRFRSGPLGAGSVEGWVPAKGRFVKVIQTTDRLVQCRVCDMSGLGRINLLFDQGKAPLYPAVDVSGGRYRVPFTFNGRTETADKGLDSVFQEFRLPRSAIRVGPVSLRVGLVRPDGADQGKPDRIAFGAAVSVQFIATMRYRFSVLASPEASQEFLDLFGVRAPGGA